MRKYLAKSKEYPEDKVIEVETLKELAEKFNPKYYDLYQLVPAFPVVEAGQIWVSKNEKNDPGVSIIDGNTVYDSDPNDRPDDDNHRYVTYQCNDTSNIYFKKYIAFIEYFIEVRE